MTGYVRMEPYSEDLFAAAVRKTDDDEGASAPGPQEPADPTSPRLAPPSAAGQPLHRLIRAPELRHHGVRRAVNGIHRTRTGRHEDDT